MFELDLDWLQIDAKSLLERVTAAQIRMAVGEQVFTRGYETGSKILTDCVMAPAYPMALWFASSWWRIGFEPLIERGTYPPTRWRLAHDLPAAGWGYNWPPVRFATDGRDMQITTVSGSAARWDSIRYQAAPSAVMVERGQFEQVIASFIDMTIARLLATGSDPDPLRILWTDVQAERGDPDVASWRQMEARLGFDSDTAPDAILDLMEALIRNAGVDAAAEAAPVIGSVDPVGRLEELQAFAGQAGVEARFDPVVAPSQADSLPSWERGRLLARTARQHLAVPPGPLRGRALWDAFGLPVPAPEPETSGRIAPISLGVRHKDRRGATLHFRRRTMTGRRFEAARFFADHLIAPAADRWLPQTDTATMRQKVQRAFATEFLVPIDDLQGFLGDDRTDAAMDEAGAHYEVSPVAIQRHLANHEEIGPNAFSL